METTSINNEFLLKISKLALSRISRFSSIAEPNISRSFLFDNDNFCGIRFVAGAFRAQWLFGQEHIEFAREGKFIDQIRVVESTVAPKRAA